MPFKIISKYIASEFNRYFMLFLGAFVLMILVGNFFGNLADVFTDWKSFFEVPSRNGSFAASIAGTNNTNYGFTGNYCHIQFTEQEC